METVLRSNSIPNRRSERSAAGVSNRVVSRRGERLTWVRLNAIVAMSDRQPACAPCGD